MQVKFLKIPLFEVANNNSELPFFNIHTKHSSIQAFLSSNNVRINKETVLTLLIEKPLTSFEAWLYEWKIVIDCLKCII